MIARGRAVLVYRQTDYEGLLNTFGTPGQAGFFLKSRGMDLDEVRARHRHQAESLALVAGAVPSSLRQARVERQDLDRFSFEPDDLVVVVGQDGLVANVARFLSGQDVVGVNPEPDRNEGMLVTFTPSAAAQHLRAPGAVRREKRTMVEARLDDGQTLCALNELFWGHPSHQSARYRLCYRKAEERHSSSGLLVSTGTGASGWARSIARERRSTLPTPLPEARELLFFVREAWPSRATQAELTEGVLEEGECLRVEAEMDGVVFGDGVEADRLQVRFGQRIELRSSERQLHLLKPGR